MSRDPRYQKLLNSKRWAETKAIVWRRAGGMCERCKAEGQEYGRKIGDPDLMRDGYIRAGVDCHHIVPVETGKTLEEMERLCFDVNNIRLLCVPCHIKTHQKMGQNTNANRKQRREDRMNRWIEHLKNLGNEQ